MKTKLDYEVLKKMALYSALAGGAAGIAASIPLLGFLVGCLVCLIIPLAGGFAGYWGVKEHDISKEEQSDALIIGALSGGLSGLVGGFLYSLITVVVGFIFGVTAFSLLGTFSNEVGPGEVGLNAATWGLTSIFQIFIYTIGMAIVFAIAGLIGGLIFSSQKEEKK